MVRYDAGDHFEQIFLLYFLQVVLLIQHQLLIQQFNFMVALLRLLTLLNMPLVTNTLLLGNIDQRDGIVVRASASQSVDQGFIPFDESYQKTFKNGIRSFPA